MARFHLWKVDKVVRGVHDAILVISLWEMGRSSTIAHVDERKGINQGRFKTVALSRRYEIYNVLMSACEHFFAELSNAGKKGGKAGWMDGEGKDSTSFGCVEERSMSESGFDHH